MKLGAQLGLDSGHIVLGGDARRPPNGAQASVRNREVLLEGSLIVMPGGVHARGSGFWTHFRPTLISLCQNDINLIVILLTALKHVTL